VYLVMGRWTHCGWVNLTHVVEIYDGVHVTYRLIWEIIVPSQTSRQARSRDYEFRLFSNAESANAYNPIFQQIAICMYTSVLYTQNVCISVCMCKFECEVTIKSVVASSMIFSINEGNHVQPIIWDLCWTWFMLDSHTQSKLLVN
jgi:hypothetical protein